MREGAVVARRLGVIGGDEARWHRGGHYRMQCCDLRLREGCRNQRVREGQAVARRLGVVDGDGSRWRRRGHHHIQCRDQRVREGATVANRFGVLVVDAPASPRTPSHTML